MTTNNLNPENETVDSELNISTGSAPLTLEEYIKVAKATIGGYGFAVPTNPTFYESGYAHHLKDWKEQNDSMTRESSS